MGNCPASPRCSILRATWRTPMMWTSKYSPLYDSPLGCGAKGWIALPEPQMNEQHCEVWPDIAQKKAAEFSAALSTAIGLSARIIVIIVVVVIIVVAIARRYIGVGIGVVIGARIAIRKRPIIVVPLEIADPGAVVSEIVAS